MSIVNPSQYWNAFLGQRGVINAKFDKAGRLQLLIDDRYQIDCQLCSGGLVLKSRIGQLPADLDIREALLTKILQQVTAIIKTRRETPVLAQDKNIVLLQQWLHNEATFKANELTLDGFVQALLAWKDWFQRTSGCYGSPLY